MAKSNISMYFDSFPGIKQIHDYYVKNKGLVHGSNLIAKVKMTNVQGRKDKLINLIAKYNAYLKGQLDITDSDTNYNLDSLSLNKDKIDSEIEERVKLLNQYYSDFSSLEIEGNGDDYFDSRSKIRSTILEEFMYLLFKKFVESLTANHKKGVLKNGSIKAYSNLYFTAKGLVDFVDSPSLQINTKNQDYSIYREVEIALKGSKVQTLKAAIPILAIENKTYLDKTMLEGAIATAEKIKMGAPYSVFIVVTETYAVDNSVDPVYSRIDQIFVLRKCKEEARGNHEISVEVVQDMFWFVVDRLKRPWSNIVDKVKEGCII